MPGVADRSDIQTLDNFIGGRWVSVADDRVLRRAQSRRRRRHRSDAAVDVRRRRRRRPGGGARVSGLARHAGQRARAGALPVQGAARAALRGAGAHRHDRARQDARRGARQRAPRHRVRRGGVRRAVADAGRCARGHRARHRLPRRAPAARRLRRHRAVQLPGDGADVVPAVRHRHRQHVRAEAVGAGAAVAAQDGRPARAVRPAARRRQPRQRRHATSSTRSAITRAFAPSRSSGSTPVAKHVYQRATHAGKRVQALGGAKNFVVVMPDADLDRSMGIISESFYGCAGERCLAGQHARAGRRASMARRAIAWSQSRQGAEGRRRHRAGRDDGAGHQREASRARRRLHRQGRRRRREAARRRPADARARSAARLSSSGRRCSTRCRRRWRSATTRSSDRSRRSVR